MIHELEAYLCSVTGFTACSLQPNSGAQGEFAGLLTIKAYHEHHGNPKRNIALIPASAHGTNPASAVVAGMHVVVTACDDNGNIIVQDILDKANEYKDQLACLMVTYPSTHGVLKPLSRKFVKSYMNMGIGLYGRCQYECSSRFNQSGNYWGRCMSS